MNDIPFLQPEKARLILKEIQDSGPIAEDTDMSASDEDLK